MGEIWNDRSVNPTNTLKVSVLATGELVLDGQPVTLPALEQALGQATKDDTVVWYYRENAAGDPPAVVAKRPTASRFAFRLAPTSRTQSPSSFPIWRRYSGRFVRKRPKVNS